MLWTMPKTVLLKMPMRALIPSIALLIYTLGHTLGESNPPRNASASWCRKCSDNTLVGNSSNNILEGKEGNDVLNGGLGADTLIGGMGDDIYTVDNRGDVVVEAEGEGEDTIYASVDYTIANSVEKLVLTGYASINATTAIMQIIFLWAIQLQISSMVA